MPNKPIRVLLVDDSPFALAVLKKLLSRSSEVEVVGTASNGKEALDLIPILNPAVVCTDLEMPVMSGLELTKTIMARFPRPTLVVSSLVQSENADNIFAVLEAGAIDILPKPRAGRDIQSQWSVEELIRKIRVVAGVTAFRRRPHAVEGSDGPRQEGDVHRGIRLVAIGASAGGPQALNKVLRSLPESFPVPILCVQHIGPGFLRGLVDWLGLDSKLRIQIAEPGEHPCSGAVYFPQEGTHLIVDRNGRLASSLEPSVNGHRPSVTVTFKSVSAFYRDAVAGVLLTGMGEDGADGLKAIADSGGLTIAQDEQTSIVFGMPRHAIELGAARYILPVERIAETLMTEIGNRQEQL